VKKILSSILAITMLLTTLSSCVIPASAATELPFDAITETFEDYTAENWVGYLSENIVTGVQNMGEKTWQIYGKGFSAEDTFIGVTNDPVVGGTRGQVLKIDLNNTPRGTGTSVNSWVQVRRNVNEGSKVSRANLSTGKKLVFEVDSYFPSTRTGASEAQFLNWSTGKPSSPQNKTHLGIATYGLRAGKRGIHTGVGYGKEGFARSGVTNVGEWETTKLIIDVSEDASATHLADTTRMLVNGRLQTVAIRSEGMEDGSALVNPAFKAKKGDRIIDTWHAAFTDLGDGTLVSKYSDLYGVVFANGVYGEDKGASGDTEYYIDNLKVYWIDTFKQEGAVTYSNVDENGNWYEGAIAIPFNNEIKETVEVYEYSGASSQTMAAATMETYTLSNLVAVLDAEGNEKAGTTATVSEDGKTLLVTPPKGLTAGETYSIVVNTRFSDVNGQGLWTSGSADETKEIAEFTMGVDPYAHVLYDIDFEDENLEKGVNWIDHRDDNRYVDVPGLDLGAVTINKNSSAGAHEVMVVDDPADTTNGNKVLALTSAGTNGKPTKVRFNANGKEGVARSDMGVGKKLVYKAKIFIPSDYQGAESTALVNPNSETSTSASTASGIAATLRTDPRFFVATFGKYGYTQARSTTSKTSTETYNTVGKWVEWKHVADVSKSLSATHSDTVRAYVDDRMVLAKIDNTGTNGVHTSSDKYDLSVGTWLIDYPTTSSADDLQALENGGHFSIGDTWWGSHFTINPPSSAGENKYTYYIDDVEAYWIDALTLNAINANEYNGGKVVLEFNQKLREEVEYFKGGVTSDNLNKVSVSDLFKIVDSTGAEVEGGIAESSLSADGKKVYIVPSEDLAKGVNYKIEISPYLIDEYGQGLENNSKATYVDLVISENYVPFTVELSRDEIAGFDTGRDGVTVTAKFSVAVDSENIENNIVATNTDTGAVATGWTYEFGKTENGETDYTTVIFDFAGLEKANYTVKSTDEFAAVNAATLANALEITIKAAQGAIVLFDENFESGYATGNLLVDSNKTTDESLSTNSKYTNFTLPSPDGVGSWDIQLNGSPAEISDTFEIVNAPEGMGTGKVLKVAITRGGSSGSSNYIAFRRNFDAARNAYRFDEGEYAGKVLVYEADVYTPELAADIPYMQLSTYTKEIRSFKDGLWKIAPSSTGQVRISGGSYQSTFTTYGHSVSWQRSSSADNLKDAPGNVRIAVDQATEVDTIRAYVNGKMNTLSVDKVAQLKGHPMNDPEGRYDFGPSIGNADMKVADQEYNMNTAVVPSSGEKISNIDGTCGIYSQLTKGEYYIDNFKAYLVDAFEVEEVTGYGNNFNTEKGRITFTFSKKVDLATATENENIVLIDETGNVVADGIESVTAKDGGYQLEVKLSETVAKEKEYTVWLKVGLRDCDGLSLRTQYSYYLYDIDAHYEKVEGKDNVYLIERVNSKDTIEGTYTPRVMDGDKVVTPAYLTYYKADGTTVAAQAATDMYVKDYAKMKSKITIVTSKSNSLSATATPAVVDGNTVTTKVSFSNPEVEAMDVWCVIAAFGEYNEMLGSAVVDVSSIDASTVTGEFEVSFTTKAGKTVENVKMFVWNNNDDMKTYQNAESIWGE